MTMTMRAGMDSLNVSVTAALVLWEAHRQRHAARSARARDTVRAKPMTTPLFGDPEPTPAGTPLAERVRPRSLDELVGQSHLVGPGKPLRRALEQGLLHSLILWGPPGTGKTTHGALARVGGGRGLRRVQRGHVRHSRKSRT